jgi:hypothetical protein
MFSSRDLQNFRTPLGVRCQVICMRPVSSRVVSGQNIALLKECVILVVKRSINIPLLRSVESSGSAPTRYREVVLTSSKPHYFKLNICLSPPTMTSNSPGSTTGLLLVPMNERSSAGRSVKVSV